MVTNIDPEHLDYYKEFSRVKEAFRTFVEFIPFYGFGVLCIDHPEVQALLPQLTDRKIITYGLGPLAQVRGLNLVLDLQAHASMPRSLIESPAVRASSRTFTLRCLASTTC